MERVLFLLTRPAMHLQQIMVEVMSAQVHECCLMDHHAPHTKTLDQRFKRVLHLNRRFHSLQFRATKSCRNAVASNLATRGLNRWLANNCEAGDKERRRKARFHVHYKQHESTRRCREWEKLFLKKFRFGSMAMARAKCHLEDCAPFPNCAGNCAAALRLKAA